MDGNLNERQLRSIRLELIKKELDKNRNNLYLPIKTDERAMILFFIGARRFMRSNVCQRKATQQTKENHPFHRRSDKGSGRKEISNQKLLR